MKIIFSNFLSLAVYLIDRLSNSSENDCNGFGIFKIFSKGTEVALASIEKQAVAKRTSKGSVAFKFN